MKKGKLNLEIQDSNGEIISSKQLEVNDNDILIIKFPADMRGDNLNHLAGMLNRAFENGGIALVPDNLDFMVIKKS